VWEFGAPVPIKYIVDPTLQAIPAVAVHPDGESFVGQCMDNSLMVFYAGERVSVWVWRGVRMVRPVPCTPSHLILRPTSPAQVGINRKKTFRGHVTAGFACQPAFSPDGKWLMSGDGEGSLWIWDWRSGRMVKKLPRCHEGGPAICAAWHPLNPSTVATCGWDGLIRLWN